MTGLPLVILMWLLQLCSTLAQWPRGGDLQGCDGLDVRVNQTGRSRSMILKPP